MRARRPHGAGPRRTDRLPGTALTRRDFLLLASVCAAAAPWHPASGQDGAPREFTLERFLRLSEVLTGVAPLTDDAAGRQYLAALLGRPAGARLLEALWRDGGFGGPNAPASVDDLLDRGVYDRPELRQLADTITVNWYSGLYSTPDGVQRVATYTNALAWTALGYRPSGPSDCGGAFGHWADAPPV